MTTRQWCTMGGENPFSSCPSALPCQPLPWSGLRPLPAGFRLAFSRRGLPTITPLWAPSVHIGQRWNLSTSDIARVLRLYDCSQSGHDPPKKGEWWGGGSVIWGAGRELLCWGGDHEGGVLGGEWVRSLGAHHRDAAKAFENPTLTYDHKNYWQLGTEPTFLTLMWVSAKNPEKQTTSTVKTLKSRPGQVFPPLSHSFNNVGKVLAIVV